MPSTRSAKKRVRQNAVRRDRNQSRRSAVKTQIRKFLDAVHEKDIDRSKEEYHRAARILDQTSAAGTYHKNTAARKKSRLAARLNSLLAADQ
ncbi:MAG: 30S ribosomal protein S20 [Phycisphaerae bacterium]